MLNQLELKKLIKKRKINQKFSLILAIMNQQVEMVERLLKSGLDCNFQVKWGWTPLMLAVAQKDREIIKLLIKNKADMNLVNNMGWSALMIAVNYLDDLELLELLVRAGADISIKSKNGSTALDIAKKYNKGDFLDFLNKEMEKNYE